MPAKKSRRRGVVLSSLGQHRLETARRQLEKKVNGGDRFTLEELSERTQLALSTITRVLDAQAGVDKQTLDQVFAAFDLILTRTDYQHPGQTEASVDSPALDPIATRPADLPDPPVASQSAISYATVSQVQTATAPSPVLDWGEAIDVSTFYGRSTELSTLRQWIQQDRCRLVAILGMGGIGKTALSVKLAQQLAHSKDDQHPAFEFIVWRTLRNAPPLDLLLIDLIQVLSCQQESLLSLSVPALLNRLMYYLRQHCCLLILDNGETLLQDGQFTGTYRQDYESYGELLRQVGEVPHQSCVVFTSREKPDTIANLEGATLPVRSFALSGLPLTDSDCLFDAIGLSPSPAGRYHLASLYGGNPLAMKIVATSVRELFDGDVDTFLEEETTVFNGIRRLLDQQCQRLTQLEQQVMVWLAINREWVTITELLGDIVPSVTKQRLLETLESLSRRSLIEQKSARFTQQPVVMEYMTEYLINQVEAEIQTAKVAIATDPNLLNHEFSTFNTYALIKATAKEYVRESQSRLILQPIANHLCEQFTSQAALEQQILRILTMVKRTEIKASSYGAGNLINLMTHLRLDVSGYDFSHLTLRQACLQQAPLHRVKLTGAHVIACQFAEPFRHPTSLAVSPQGDRMAIGGEDGVIQVWQVSTGEPVCMINTLTVYTFALTFSQDGQTLVSGGCDRLMQFWDIATGNCLQTRELEGPIWALALSPDGQLLASATSDQNRTIHLWHGQTGQHLATFTGHTGQASSLAFIPSASAATGWLLVSSSQDCTLKIWDIDQGKCRQTLTGHTGMAFSVSVHPQGQLLASGSFDHSIKLWDWQTGHCLRTLLGHTADVCSVSFSPDGKLLASCSNDCTIRLWDVDTGDCLQVLQGHRDHVWKIAFTTSQLEHKTQQLLLVSASVDQTVRFWHISQGPTETSAVAPSSAADPNPFSRQRPLHSYCLKTIQGSTMGIRTIASHPQGGLLASAGLSNQIWLWNEAGRCLRRLEGHTAGIWKVAFHPTEPILASASLNGEVKLWDLEAGRCLRTLYKNNSWIQALSFSAQGPLISATSSDATIRFWDSQTGDCYRSITLEAEAYLLGMACHPQGHYFVTAGNDDRLRWWDTETGECLRVVPGNNGGHAWCVAFHPQGHLLASLGNDHSVNLWDAEQGVCLRRLEGHTGVLGSLAFSLDGEILASGRSDRNIRLWDVATGECLKVLEGHTRGITAVVFLSGQDGAPQILASGSLDETVRLWNVETGECLHQFHPDRIYEDMDITGIMGLTEAQTAMLKQLGAVERLDSSPLI